MEILNSCPDDHMSEAVTSSYYCQPVKKILKLNLPQNVSFTHVSVRVSSAYENENKLNFFQMSPSHVSVNQCGGGCHNTDHSCVSISTSIKTIPVILSR